MSNQLVGIEFGLAGLLKEVIGLRLAIVGEGRMPKPGDPKTLSQFARLREIGGRVGVVLRTLKSMEHSQLLRADRLHALPRDRRYGERQSINSHVGSIERVRALAFKLANELHACYGDSLTPTTADLIEGTQDVLSEFGAFIDRVHTESTLRQVGDGPIFQGNSPAGVTAADLMTQVWLLLACVIACTRERKG